MLAALTSSVPAPVADWWPTIATGLLAASVTLHFFDWALVLRFLRYCGGAKVKPSVEAFKRTHVHKASVTTRDLDLMMHCNNARYPREADFARHRHFKACGLFDVSWGSGLNLVTGAQTIRYRRELPFRRNFEVRTTVVGWDEKALYLEQLFVSKDRKGHEDVYAVLYVREAVASGRKKLDAPLHALFEKAGWKDQLPPTQAPPADVAAWHQSTLDASARVCPKRQ
uniref:Thioesterase domain-containing protein n=1 Tax=Neobodo designis TaxID=312471 RepID=A0A7S1LEN2_NEODS|mmetsp:Transcript_20454/g.63619  ORF Transcript_20454/g.63619 Transcript_20454/m.63619 type:complete len:226 (+) Transcript_20454:39-716(+)